MGSLDSIFTMRESTRQSYYSSRFNWLDRMFVCRRKISPKGCLYLKSCNLELESDISEMFALLHAEVLRHVGMFIVSLSKYLTIREGEAGSEHSLDSHVPPVEPGLVKDASLAALAQEMLLGVKDDKSPKFPVQLTEMAMTSC